jgi:dTDP-4-dehydrorhamnose reductase
MKFAVVGASGLLGQEFVTLPVSGGLYVSSFGRNNLNLESDAGSIAQTIGETDFIINCVAYTAVDLAESNPEDAFLVNHLYAEKLAMAAKLIGARFMHVSTDYVFDGQATAPYLISDEPNPQGVYGASKRAGELAVIDSGADATIFRTAWLYGAHGKNFAKTIAGVLEKNGSARVVNDQVGQPTWTKDLAELILSYCKSDDRPQIVHATASGQATWFDFAQEVALSLGMQDTAVTPVTTSEFPTPAQRPAWSVLDNRSPGHEVIGDWRDRWRIAAPSVLGLG